MRNNKNFLKKFGFSDLRVVGRDVELILLSAGERLQVVLLRTVADLFRLPVAEALSFCNIVTCGNIAAL